MTRRRLPPLVHTAVEAVRGATDKLIRCAEAGEPEVIRAAIDDRASAVRQLEKAYGHCGDAIDGLDRKTLAETLAVQANEAESALRRLAEQTDRDLQALKGCTKMLRGYAGDPKASSALDRSG